VDGWEGPLRNEEVVLEDDEWKSLEELEYI
jgi:hypothetical protein